MASKTYDSKQVAITIGVALMSGFAENSMIKVERNEDTWKLQVGTDGTTTRSKTNNRSGKITLSLMQTSASNAILSGFALLDETLNAGAVPVLIKDLNGLSLYSAAQAWVMKPPAGDLEANAKERTWVIETGELLWFEGGN
jgi:hypothetical protein